MAAAILFCWCVTIFGPEEEGAGEDILTGSDREQVVATCQSKSSDALQHILLYFLCYSR